MSDPNWNVYRLERPDGSEPCELCVYRKLKPQPADIRCDNCNSKACIQHSWLVVDQQSGVIKEAVCDECADYYRGRYPWYAQGLIARKTLGPKGGLT